MSVQRRTLRVGPLLSAVAALLVSASWAVAVPGWSTETVDGTADSGFYNSLAFHPVTGLPAIAHSGKSGNKPTLKFAQWNGASWELQVAFTGKPGELGGISLGFDGSGNPAVSFVEITGGVKLARKTGSSWATETIDSKGAGLSSLVVHGGQPWIAYTTNNALKLAHKVGSAWTTETVDGSGMSYVSLAFAPDGNPSVAYRNGTTTATLRFAHKSGSTWTIQNVETGFYYGIFSSLAYDPLTGYPTIAHGIGTGGIRFARWDGSQWLGETAATCYSCTEESHAYDAGGVAAIAYVAGVDGTGHKQLRIARRTGCSGACWTDELVVDAAPQQVQWRTSLAFGPTGAAAISYGEAYLSFSSSAQETP